MATVDRTASPMMRRQYRLEIIEALNHGATRTDVATVVRAFKGEHPDVDEVRAALQQYVPATALHDPADNPHRP